MTKRITSKVNKVAKVRDGHEPMVYGMGKCKDVRLDAIWESLKENGKATGWNKEAFGAIKGQLVPASSGALCVQISESKTKREMTQCLWICMKTSYEHNAGPARMDTHEARAAELENAGLAIVPPSFPRPSAAVFEDEALNSMGWSTSVHSSPQMWGDGN